MHHRQNFLLKIYPMINLKESLLKSDGKNKIKAVLFSYLHRYEAKTKVTTKILERLNL